VERAFSLSSPTRPSRQAQRHASIHHPQIWDCLWLLAWDCTSPPSTKRLFSMTTTTLSNNNILASRPLGTPPTPPHSDVEGGWGQFEILGYGGQILWRGAAALVAASHERERDSVDFDTCSVLSTSSEEDTGPLEPSLGLTFLQIAKKEMIHRAVV
jgi:hypothetical protein